MLTDNYGDSVWGNQEAGIIFGKGGKNISLIIENVGIKKFGFLESLQGIIVEQTNIEACLDKIIALILK